MNNAEITLRKNLAGKTAIPFSLRDAKGRMHSLDEYRGSWLLLVFHRHLG
jgi:peroxiredoxin